VEFAVLGPLLVVGDDGPIDIAGAKERTLLAHLVARAGELVSTDALVDGLWGESPPRTAGKSLQTYVLRLRNALEPERNGSPRLLVTEGPGYRLAVPHEAVDAWRFTRLVELGRRAYRDGRMESAASTLRDALELWRGPAYTGFEHTSFGGGEARRLDELRLGALEDRIAADIALGAARESVPELEALVHTHPLRERFWELLVLALYRSGRQADALAAYARAREVLVEELGVDPGEDLRALHTRVLAQDPALLRPTGHSVPSWLVPPSGAFVGRDPELAALRAAWARALAGGSVTVWVCGRPGSGARRLAAEFAAEVVQQGFDVRDRAQEMRPDAEPELLVTDVPALAAAAEDAPTNRLTLVLAGSTQPPPGAERLDLGPLRADDVRLVAADYVDRQVDESELSELMRQSGGLPARVHDAALTLARRQASARVGVAAERTGQIQQALGDARDELRDRVEVLEAVHDRAATLPRDVCPWKGLVAYDVEDAPWFSGRERLVAELLVRLASARLVAVVGASGSGKSSLVRAGLLASLRNGSMPGSESWVQLLMRPGAHPMRELARVALRGADPSRDRDQVADLLERLVYGDGAAGRVVLVVDQLEEAWTVCSDETERTAFLDALGDVVDTQPHCTVVFVVRADHVGELANQPVLARTMADATVLVGAPTSAEVRRAVERPAELAGLSLEPGLLDAIVDDAGDEPGSLPLLSTAMTELWERRDATTLPLGAYVGLGGIDGAIARIAERVYGALSDADQAATKVLMLRLAGPGDAESTSRQRIRLAEVARLPDPRVRAVVGRLADARLLTVRADEVEVAHEALFREWPRLRGWLEESSAGRAVQRRLSAAAREWDLGERDTSEVWRGARLAAGLDFAATHPNEVTDLERNFLDAGQAAQEAELAAAEERATTATRQNRRLRWLLGGLGLFLVAALVAGSLAVRAEGRAERETRSATARELSAASLANLETDPELSTLLALEAIETTREPDGVVLREAEEALHRAVGATRVVQTYPDVGGSLSWSPDGTLFVTEGPENSGVIDVRDVESGETVKAWTGHEIDVNDVAFSPDGSMLATTGDDGALRLWDPRTGAPRGELAVPDSGDVWYPAFSADGALVSATWLSAGYVGVLDVASGDPVAKLGPFELVSGSTFDPRPTDGPGVRLMIAGFAAPDADLTTDGRVQPVVVDIAGIPSWSPDGRLVAAATQEVDFYDPDTGQLLFSGFGHNAGIQRVAWSADSATVASTSDDGTVKIWDVAGEGARERLSLATAANATGTVGVALSPDADRVMAGNLDVSQVTMWDVSATGGAEWINVPGNPHGATEADFLADGSAVVASAGVGEANVVDVDRGDVVRTMGEAFPEDDEYETWYNQFSAIEVDPTGELVATAVRDRVQVMLADTGADVFRRANGWYVYDLDWSPDGSMLAIAGSDSLATVVDRQGGTLAVFDVDRLDDLDDLPSDKSVNAVSFSRDGEWLIVSDRLQLSGEPQPRRVMVIDLDTEEVVARLEASSDDLAASLTDDVFVGGGAFGPASIFGLPDGGSVATLTGGSDALWSIDVSPDGSLVAGGGGDGAVRLWDAETGVELLTLRGHEGLVGNVQFSPDGRRLLSSGSDELVRVWAVDLDDLIGIAQEKLTRGLTDDECRQYLHQDRCSS
jgi:WD40 repeat protein/DNA-binding SARP family transcriptional activator